MDAKYMWWRRHLNDPALGVGWFISLSPMQILAGTDDWLIQNDTQESTTRRIDGTYVSNMKYKMFLLSSKWNTSFG